MKSQPRSMPCLARRVLLMAFLACCSTGFAAEPSASPENFQLPVLGSTGEFGLMDARGKVVYVDFWASWCGPCRKAIPLYESLYQEIGGQHFEILAINVDENEQDAVDFLAQHPVTYTVLLDPKGTTAASWGITVMPTSFLLDREGRVVREFPGFDTSHFEDIRHEIETLLAQ